MVLRSLAKAVVTTTLPLVAWFPLHECVCVCVCATEITEFCERKFKVTFPLMDKIDVNGEAAEPLYKFLKSEKKSALFAESIMVATCILAYFS